MFESQTHFFFEENKKDSTWFTQPIIPICVLNVQINFLKTKVIIISLIIICSICHRQGQGKLVFGLGKVWEISEIFFFASYILGNVFNILLCSLWKCETRQTNWFSATQIDDGTG